MKSSPECEEYRCEQKFVLQENKSKITFLNPNQDKILTIKVDGCAISDNEALRCDYALMPSDEVEIYVELKGSDIVHAVEQIKSTIGLLWHNPQRSRSYVFLCLLACLNKQQLYNSYKVSLKKTLMLVSESKTFKMSMI